MDARRPTPPLAAGETETLLGFLDFQRATFAWKVSGLDEDGLRATVAASPITLGGLLKHLAVVEAHWFVMRLHEQPMPEPFDLANWEADPEWDWHSAAADSPADLLALWEGAVARSRALLAQSLAAGLDQRISGTTGYGHAPSLRWILCHLIEEYARHNGHADLLRESVDGQTGE
jgi:hypothetical protein